MKSWHLKNYTSVDVYALHWYLGSLVIWSIYIDGSLQLFAFRLYSCTQHWSFDLLSSTSGWVSFWVYLRSRIFALPHLREDLCHRLESSTIRPAFCWSSFSTMSFIYMRDTQKKEACTWLIGCDLWYNTLHTHSSSIFILSKRNVSSIMSTQIAPVKEIWTQVTKQNNYPNSWKKTTSSWSINGNLKWTKSSACA